MSLKSEVKKTASGHGLLGIALAIGIGVAIVTPLIAMGYAFLMSKLKGPATSTTSPGA